MDKSHGPTSYNPIMQIFFGGENLHKQTISLDEFDTSAYQTSRKCLVKPLGRRKFAEPGNPCSFPWYGMALIDSPKKRNVISWVLCGQATFYGALWRVETLAGR